MMQIGAQGTRLNLMQKWDMNELWGVLICATRNPTPTVRDIQKMLGFVPQPNLLDLISDFKSSG